MTPSRPLRFAFVRPGLGIGGAERLVVDAALELQARGHEVTLFVGDRQEAQLDEVKAGRIRVVAVGGRLPAHVAQRLRAPAAILRAAWAARALARARPAPDVVVVDLVPHVIPLLRRLIRAPVACYCHFPDLLLAPRRRGLYALYRAPLDRLEERGLAAADRVLVNSRFTASVVQVTFPRLDATAFDVVHPGVEVGAAPPAPPAGEPLTDLWGIGPREARGGARRVVAVTRGGPTETIVEGETGWLASPTPAAFATALARVLGDPAAARRMGEAGWVHVRDNFSRRAF